MESLFIILAFMVICFVMNLFCFVAGAKIGQKVSKGETIETPELNPMKAWREREERKQAEKEENRISTIMENIENYDGTSAGQKDVPRG